MTEIPLPRVTRDRAAPIACVFESIITIETCNLLTIIYLISSLLQIVIYQ